MFRKLQLLLDVPEFLSNPLSPDRFLARLPGVTRPRLVSEIAFDQTRQIKEEDNINCGPTFLTNAVFQSLKHMSTFKEVVVVLPAVQSGKVVWAPSITRELESGLGPNLSRDSKWLEYKPGGKPRIWSAKCIPFDEASRSYSTDHPSSCH